MATREALVSELSDLGKHIRGEHAHGAVRHRGMDPYGHSYTASQEVYVVDIALARLGDAKHADGNAAADQLLLLSADAERCHFIGWALEAKLAAWRVWQPHGVSAAGPLRDDI